MVHRAGGRSPNSSSSRIAARKQRCDARSDRCLGLAAALGSSTFHTMKPLLRSTLIATASLVAACGRTPTYDLVVANGRVINPESNLDATRNVGIRAGRVE